MEPSLVLDYENKINFQLALGHYQPMWWDPARALGMPGYGEQVESLVPKNEIYYLGYWAYEMHCAYLFEHGRREA